MILCPSFFIYCNPLSSVRRYAMTDLQKQQITEMRENGSTYADIAAALSLPIGTIKSYFSRNPSSKALAPDIPHDMQEISSGCCKRCGQLLVNTPGHRQKTFCSSECQRLYWREHPELMNHTAIIQKRCSSCGKVFSDYAGHKRKYCSHACYITHRYGGVSYESERTDLSCDDEAVSKNA